jgi:hypothetical protein
VGSLAEQVAVEACRFTGRGVIIDERKRFYGCRGVAGSTPRMNGAKPVSEADGTLDATLPSSSQVVESGQQGG